jgi:SulP family sulfate permease
MAEISNVEMITREVQGDEDVADDPNATILREVPLGVEVFEVYGPFFFGMIDTFQNAVREFQKRKHNGIHLVFSGVHSQPLISFQRSGLQDKIGIENLMNSLNGISIFIKTDDLDTIMNDLHKRFIEGMI